MASVWIDCNPRGRGAISGWHSASMSARSKVVSALLAVFPYPVFIGLFFWWGVPLAMAVMTVVPVGLCVRLLTKHHSRILKLLTQMLTDEQQADRLDVIEKRKERGNRRRQRKRRGERFESVRSTEDRRVN